MPPPKLWWLWQGWEQPPHWGCYRGRGLGNGGLEAPCGILDFIFVSYTSPSGCFPLSQSLFSPRRSLLLHRGPPRCAWRQRAPSHLSCCLNPIGAGGHRVWVSACTQRGCFVDGEHIHLFYSTLISKADV